MKRNNKGNTLIEVVAVIAIISLIATIAVPDFLSLIGTENDKMKNSRDTLIIAAAKIFVSNNREKVNEKIKNSNSDNGYCITIGALKAYEYVDIPDLETVTNKPIDLSKCVYISSDQIKTGNDEIENKKIIYKYKVSTQSYNEINSCGDYLPPVLKIQKKESSSIECSKNNVVSSLEEYKESCKVISQDNKDGEKIIEHPEPEINGNTYIYKYNTEDECENFSKELKVKVTVTEQ